MCRNIKTLFKYVPPATADEIRAASVQFVPKISGTTKPSKANEHAFNRAVDAVAATVSQLLESLTTASNRKDREAEAAKARARTAPRFRDNRKSGAV